jgi:hypothetical protein
LGKVRRRHSTPEDDDEDEDDRSGEAMLRGEAAIQDAQM